MDCATLVGRMLIRRIVLFGVTIALLAAFVPYTNASGLANGCSVAATPVANVATCTFILCPAGFLAGGTVTSATGGATITVACSATASCTAAPLTNCRVTVLNPADSTGTCTIVAPVGSTAYGRCGVIAPPPPPPPPPPPLPTTCANGVDDDGDGLTDYPDDPGCTWPGDGDEFTPSSPHPYCPSEPTHTYGTGGSVGGRSATVTGGDDVGVGLVTVTDTNAEDCNGDGIAGDWDGDYDGGVGGGAFGWGPWADEATCNNAFNVHGPNVAVNDLVFGSAIGFVVGEDDQAGPVIIPVDEDNDGTPDGYVCETDGSITPGDPTTDPTADADDCLSEHFVGTGATCGTGGGDGLFWVFLDGAAVEENGGVGVGNGPTAGTITAF